jgi:hypothetical protein
MKLNPNILFFHYDCRLPAGFKVSRFQSFKAKGKDNSRVPTFELRSIPFFSAVATRVEPHFFRSYRRGLSGKPPPSGNDAFYLTAGLLLSMLLFLTLKL